MTVSRSNVSSPIKALSENTKSEKHEASKEKESTDKPVNSISPVDKKETKVFPKKASEPKAIEFPVENIKNIKNIGEPMICYPLGPIEPPKANKLKELGKKLSSDEIGKAIENHKADKLLKNSKNDLKPKVIEICDPIVPSKPKDSRLSELGKKPSSNEIGKAIENHKADELLRNSKNILKPKVIEICDPIAPPKTNNKLEELGKKPSSDEINEAIEKHKLDGLRKEAQRPIKATDDFSKFGPKLCSGSELPQEEGIKKILEMNK